MKEIPFAKPIINNQDIKLINNVIKSGILTHGPIGLKFEEQFSKFTNLKYCLSTTSCTSSLLMAYKLIGLKKNDEFIVPAQTHVATVNTGKFLGAKPVFVDSDLDTGNLDLEKIEKKITKKTKCITIVHFLGKPVDIEKILWLKKKYKIKIIEDCALALGSKYYGKHVGYYADFACFSFYPAKHITTGDGGMLTCSNQTDYKKAKLLRGFGVNKTFFERKTPGIYDVLSAGLNFRLSDINSALGLTQLKKLTYMIHKREKNYKKLYQSLKDFDNLKILKTSTVKNLKSSYYCLSFIIKNISRTQRNLYLKYLSDFGVGCTVHYPRAIMDYKYLKKERENKNQFLNARRISNNSINIPVGPHLKDSDIKYIIKILTKLFN